MPYFAEGCLLSQCSLTLQKNLALTIVTKIVEQDVADKVDTTYIAAQLSHLENVGITYVCTDDDQGDDEWMDEGIRYIVIKLPYEEVQRSLDIRAMMLAKVRERLGEVA